VLYNYDPVSKLPIQNIINTYNEVNEKLASTSETKELIDLGKQLKKLQQQYSLAIEIEKIIKELAENKELLKTEEKGSEMYELLNSDIILNEQKLVELEENLLSYLAPSDPKDDNDIFIEIRAGAGGDESSLFAGEIIRCYSIIAQKLGLSFKIIDFNIGTVGGYKEVVAEIRGDQAFSWFKYEGGVHRVQRVPETEKQGRVHTSTISVAIMPLIEETNDFKLDLNEVEIIASTSQGAGGQSVNTTYSAIQVLHKPTGIRAQCQDERNQQQNKIKALQILTSRVFDFYEQQRLEKEYNERKDQIGRADRSEKIRTYNFPQDRLTDHRYNKNWNQLEAIMNGEMLKIIEEIKKMEAELNLQALNE
jgi:peptide chain release factor 1